MQSLNGGRISWPARHSALIALAALTMLVPASMAQTPVSEADGAAEAHPAHIHSGTCAELGDVVVPLADVAYPAGEPIGAASTIPVKVSLNIVDMPLQELLDGEYAINIHESAEAIDVYIACGAIGGVIELGDEGLDDVRFAVTELNESGYTGTVFLQAEGEQTEVNITLVEPVEMS
jgi:hypothetical protein